jgi:hypothetical protein
MLATAICAACALPAQATVHSDVVTAGKYTQPSGAYAVAFPAHPSPLFLGKVLSVAGNVITIEGSLTANALNAVNLGLPDGVVAQYVVKVRHDRSSEGNGTQGDWFLIVSNTSSSVTVDPNPTIATSASLAAGDIVQIEKLPSLQSLFGTGTGVQVTPDTDFDDTTEDSLKLLAGTAFAGTLVYHDGSQDTEGWWDLNNFVFLGDGSQYTFAPDQMVYNLNLAGGASDVVFKGTTQCFTMSHYVGPGYNPLATGFAAPAPIGTSGLYPYTAPLITGFLRTSGFDEGVADTVTMLNGTSFSKVLLNHDGTEDAPGWWDLNDFVLAPLFPLPAGTGFLVKNLSPGTYLWRQPKP